MDNKILSTIIHKFGGGPVGINTIATAVSEDAGTIEEVYEPFLIKEGFLKRTPRGREVTALAYSHLGIATLSFTNLSLCLVYLFGRLLREFSAGECPYFVHIA